MSGGSDGLTALPGFRACARVRKGQMGRATKPPQPSQRAANLPPPLSPFTRARRNVCAEFGVPTGPRNHSFFPRCTPPGFSGAIGGKVASRRPRQVALDGLQRLSKPVATRSGHGLIASKTRAFVASVASQSGPAATATATFNPAQVRGEHLRPPFAIRPPCNSVGGPAGREGRKESNGQTAFRHISKRHRRPREGGHLSERCSAFGGDHLPHVSPVDGAGRRGRERGTQDGLRAFLSRGRRGACRGRSPGASANARCQRQRRPVPQGVLVARAMEQGMGARPTGRSGGAQ
jgi:hypothetical protein